MEVYHPPGSLVDRITCNTRRQWLFNILQRSLYRILSFCNTGCGWRHLITSIKYYNLGHSRHWYEYITVLYKTVKLQHGTCYKTVRVTKKYVLQNSMCYKTVRVTKRYVLQKSTCCKIVCVTKRLRYKTVRVTKRYMLQNGTWCKTVHF